MPPKAGYAGWMYAQGPAYRFVKIAALSAGSLFPALGHFIVTITPATRSRYPANTPPRPLSLRLRLRMFAPARYGLLVAPDRKRQDLRGGR